MTENATIAAAYADTARLVIGLINDPDDADQALQHIALHASREELMHLAYAALHTAAEMVSAEAAASVLAGEEGGALSLQSRLAVEHGLAVARASAGWAERARNRLAAEIQKEKPR